MVRMFGCERSRNAHIERKKSKMTFVVDHKPTRQEEKAIETEMNRLIEEDMPVTYEFVHVLASMYVLRRRLASLYCSEQIGMSMPIHCVFVSRSCSSDKI